MTNLGALTRKISRPLVQGQASMPAPSGDRLDTGPPQGAAPTFPGGYFR